MTPSLIMTTTPPLHAMLKLCWACMLQHAKYENYSVLLEKSSLHNNHVHRRAVLTVMGNAELMPPPLEEAQATSGTPATPEIVFVRTRKNQVKPAV